MIIYDEDLINAKDIFENDDVILTIYTFKAECFTVERLCVGIKDEYGDVDNIIELRERIL